MPDPSAHSETSSPWHHQCRLKLREPRFRWTALTAAIWLLFVFDWLLADISIAAKYTIGLFASGDTVHFASSMLRHTVFIAALLIALAWLSWAFPWVITFLVFRLKLGGAAGRRMRESGITPLQSRQPSNITQAVVASIAFIPLWQYAVFILDAAGSRLSATCAQVGTATAFFIGLAWTVWGVERGSRFYLQQRYAAAVPAIDSQPLSGGAGSNQIWNPVDLEAWYYGRRAPKLNQSITTIFGYTLAFFLLVFLFNRLGGCQEIYEMPAGGGEPKPKVQVVQIQKVIRRKFVVNPFSAVIFHTPPIEDVAVFTPDMTKHEYQIGQGKGTGAGFSGGTRDGMVRFIRLEYRGGDWDQDFGVGADLNMLLRYGIETRHKVADKTESRTIEELGRFAKGKSPPMVYMTGQQSIQLTKRETDILRDYLIDKHGMIFADNGGSSQWHAQFFAMMDKVLEGTGVYPVRVPLDDVIHRIPFRLPFLPIVAPHGGKDAWGWYKDGRWLAYYHPGDIGDAWADGHAGVRREIYEACYQLGVNVIFYAHAEYDKWLETQKKND